jgi:hypothetical protein
MNLPLYPPKILSDLFDLKEYQKLEIYLVS